MLVEVPEGENIFTYLDRRAREAYAKSEAWQRELKPGDFYLAFERSAGLWIYGEIQGPPEVPSLDGVDEEQADEMRAESEFEQRVYRDGVARGFHPAHAFSDACPEGEYGDVHISTITLILTKEQFETARRMSWPNDAERVRVLVGATRQGGEA